MNAALRLTLYGIGLLLVFGVAYLLASVLIPESLAADWLAQGQSHAH